MITIRILLLAALVSLYIAPCPAGAQGSQLPSQHLVTLIDEFLTSPLGRASLRGPLIDSAEARPDVAITISEGVAPWLLETDTTTFRQAMKALFLSAFVAGNMRQQLVSGVKGDQPYHGTAAVLGVYRFVRTKAPDYKQPILDRWILADSAGTLQATIDSAAKAARSTKQ